ncbi:hypothetical protein Tsubulata_009891 [Turnera subulata]|uniref:Protein Lines C-terminal domain-containing protein n=1 Tax=Turnera subulata TaxID=218843 RepID=A0A9Q0G6U6_9ROSI|nr:hypothetical protein Tsubulata_009891 [Turnera subulata]
MTLFFIFQTFLILYTCYICSLQRSLRIVCNSWKSFIEFSFDGRSMNESCKKRRISQGSSTIELKALPVPVKGFHPSYKVDDERHFDWRRKLWNSERQSFDKARHCLLSLKGSVKSLKEKNLFPYNPEALLKRLTKFEELCSSIKDYDLL